VYDYGDYMSAVDEEHTAVGAASTQHQRVNQVLVPYQHDFFLQVQARRCLLAWAAQPADEGSSCRLGVFEAATSLVHCFAY
jgi:hypothetical protein